MAQSLSLCGWVRWICEQIAHLTHSPQYRNDTQHTTQSMGGGSKLDLNDPLLLLFEIGNKSSREQFRFLEIMGKIFKFKSNGPIN